ncbi:hypothetical protein T440DRAFT_379994, partial [Plenodomus tracheiphilus IPT5]
NPHMAASPRTPTARKAPSTPQSPATTSSMKSAKSKQQPKPSGSQAVAVSRQRKTPAVPQGTVQAGNKRKLKMEEQSLAKASPHPMTDSSTTAEVVPTTPKKQKMNTEAQNGMTSKPGLYQLATPSQPLSTPNLQAQQQQQQQQQFSNLKSSDLTYRLLHYALKKNPGLLPGDPRTTTITSDQLSDVAHAMWQVAICTPGVMEQACIYSAMFALLKLQTLAKMNFLPSWWFMREAAAKIMVSSKWNVDDRVMQTDWVYAVDWCRKNFPGHVVKRSVEGVMEGDGKDEVIEVED